MFRRRRKTYIEICMHVACCECRMCASSVGKIRKHRNKNPHRHTHSFAQTMCKLSKNSIGFDFYFPEFDISWRARTLSNTRLTFTHCATVANARNGSLTVHCMYVHTARTHNETLFGAHTTLFLVVNATRQRLYDTHSRRTFFIPKNFRTEEFSLVFELNKREEAHKRCIYWVFITHFSASLAWLEDMLVHRVVWSFKMSSFCCELPTQRSDLPHNGIQTKSKLADTARFALSVSFLPKGH